ncbi:MAG: EamA family transporter [Shimia sp.]
MRLALLVAAAMVAFALNSILNRVALTGTETGPGAFQAMRLAAGAAMLCLLARARLDLRPSGARVVGAGALAVYMAGFSVAYVALDAGLGALILFGGVQLTMFAGAALAGEPIPVRRWMGGACAFGGLALLLWPGEAAIPLPAAAAMLAAAMGWGVYSLRGRGASDPLAETAANFAYALPLGLVVWAFLADGVDAAGAGLAVLAGAVTSGLGYALWYAVLPGLGATRGAVVQLTVPPIALALGVLLLGEAVTARFALASVLVLGGVAWALLPRSPRAAGAAR